MRLESILTTNFLKFRSWDKAFRAPVTLFCGGNEVGKTSVANAISFALTGQPRRGHIEKKKDLAALVSYGERSGNVTLNTSEETPEGDAQNLIFQRNIRTGKCSSPDMDDPFIPVCLDMHKFGSLSSEERRGMLFSDRPSFDLVSNLLKKNFRVPQKLIDSYRSWIEVGFEASLEQLRDDVRGLKGEWKGVTGEMWGAEKGGFWEPKAPIAPSSPEGYEKVVTGIELLTKEVLGESSARSAAAAKIHGAIGQKEVLDKLKASAKLDTDYSEMFTELENRYAAKKKEIKAASSALEGLIHCPGCHRPLAINMRKKTAVLVKDANTSAMELELSLMDKKIKSLSVESRVAEQAREQLQKMQKDIPDVTHEKEIIARCDERIAGFNDMLKTERALKASYENHAKEVAKAEAIDKKAKSIHDKIGALMVLGKAMASDGVPKILGATVLEDINKRLRAHAETTGWRTVRITDDAEIDADGEPYFLLSESAQWKVDAMLTLALAGHSGWDFAILDRLDVLEPKGRGNALKWLAKASADMDSIVVMATLKEAPKIKADWLDVVWMEG